MSNTLVFTKPSGVMLATWRSREAGGRDEVPWFPFRAGVEPKLLLVPLQAQIVTPFLGDLIVQRKPNWGSRLVSCGRIPGRLTRSVDLEEISKTIRSRLTSLHFRPAIRN